MYKDGASMSIGSRIQEIRGGVSGTEFCRVFGIHRNTLPRWESGETFPDGNILANICRKYKINANWLLLGTGPKNQEDSPAAELDQSILTDAIEALEVALHEKGRAMEPEKKAEIITELYLLMSEEEQTDKPSNIVKLLRLVV